MSAVRKAIKARELAGSAVAAMREELRQLEAERAELLERREAIQAAPVDLATAEAKITDLIAALREKASLPAAWLAQGPRGYVDLLRELAPGLGPNVPAPPSPWAVLALVVPDTVQEALRRQLRDAYDRLPAPMTDQERREALAAVDQELAAVERQAAEAWWAGLDAGFTLPLPDVSGEALAGLEPA